MVVVNVVIKGDKELISKLGDLSRFLKNMRGEMKGIAKYLFDFHIKQVFETEGAVFGERWASLQPRYDFKKRTEFPGRGILERTGAMRRSYKPESGKDFAKVTNTAKYAIFHQMGTKYLPPRRVTGIDQKRLTGSAEIIAKGIKGKIIKLFGN